MKAKTLVICATLLSINTFAAPPSDESVEKLLAVLKTEQQLEDKLVALDSMNRRGFTEKLTGGKEPTPEQRTAVERAVAKVSQIMRSELAWSQVRPGLVRIVQETFDQDELDGILSFYETPAGKAFLEKFPLIEQRSARHLLNLFGATRRKLEGVVESELDHLKTSE